MIASAWLVCAAVGEIPPLVTKAALAALLGYTVRAVNKLIARGELPEPFHVGRTAFWRRETLVAFFESLERRRKRRSRAGRP